MKDIYICWQSHYVFTTPKIVKSNHNFWWSHNAFLNIHVMESSLIGELVDSLLPHSH